MSEKLQKNNGLRERPLSPHLTVYRPQISSILSITHRITGVYLLLGGAILVWWLGAVAAGDEAYDTFVAYTRAPCGLIMTFLWTLAFYYHFANGIRHLFWDAGFGFEIKTMESSGWAVLIFTFLLTLATWWPFISNIMK